MDGFKSGLRLNKEELATGFLIVAAWFYFLGLWTIPFAILSGVLYAVGGAGPKWVRRIGCPVAFVAAIWLAGFRDPIYYLAPFGYFGVLCIGYGIPTIAPGRPDHDEGSRLGRWLYDTAAVRFVLGFLYAVACIPFASADVLGCFVGGLNLMFLMPFVALKVDGEVVLWRK